MRRGGGGSLATMKRLHKQNTRIAEQIKQRKHSHSALTRMASFEEGLRPPSAQGSLSSDGIDVLRSVSSCETRPIGEEGTIMFFCFFVFFSIYYFLWPVSSVGRALVL